MEWPVNARPQLQLGIPRTALEVAHAVATHVYRLSGEILPVRTAQPCFNADLVCRIIEAGSHRVSIMALGLAKLCFDALIGPALVVLFRPAMLCAGALWSAVFSVRIAFCSI